MEEVTVSLGIVLVAAALARPETEAFTQNFGGITFYSWFTSINLNFVQHFLVKFSIFAIYLQSNPVITTSVNATPRL